jgi:hypothetical protein
MIQAKEIASGAGRVHFDRLLKTSLLQNVSLKKNALTASVSGSRQVFQFKSGNEIKSEIIAPYWAAFEKKQVAKSEGIALTEYEVQQEKEIDEQLQHLLSKMKYIKLRMQDVTHEIDVVLSRRRKATDEHKYEVADELYQKYHMLTKRKSELSSFLLHKLGKQYGDLMLQRAKNVKHSSQMTALLDNFDNSTKFLKPCAFRYSLLMMGYKNLGNPTAAEDLVERMMNPEDDDKDALRVEPDAFCYAYIIDAWIAAGNAKKVKYWAEKLVKKVGYNFPAFSELVSFFAQNNQMKYALEWIRGADPKRTFLTPKAVGIILDGFKGTEKDHFDLVEALIPLLNGRALDRALTYSNSRGFADSTLLLLSSMKAAGLRSNMDQLDWKILRVQMQASGKATQELIDWLQFYEEEKTDGTEGEQANQ